MGELALYECHYKAEYTSTVDPHTYKGMWRILAASFEDAREHAVLIEAPHLDGFEIIELKRIGVVDVMTDAVITGCARGENGSEHNT